jgi:signal peptidase I
VAASVVAGSAIVLLLAVAVLVATGHRVMIEMSDSMKPAMAAGDAIVTERILARDAKRGDVITFTDPSREGRTVTHRVVSVSDKGDRLAFHTRGDANGKGERWTIASDGTVGRVLQVVPEAGYVLNWFRQPSVRFACLTLASLLIAALVLARVWGIGAGRRA